MGGKDRGAGQGFALPYPIDTLVLCFAAFTLLTSGTVLMGGSLLGLARLSLVAGLVGLAWVGWRMRARHARSHDSVTSPHSGVDADEADEADEAEPGAFMWGTTAALALVGGSLLLAFDSLIGLWLCALAGAGLVLGTNFVQEWRPTPIHDIATRAVLPLAGLSLACGVLVAVLHQSDFDDSFYVNMAVAAADAPGEPILAFDTLHGIPNVPLGLPVLRASSIEMAVALVSRLFHVETLRVAHVWLPPLLAALIPLAYARLLGVLAPRQWPWLLAGVFAYLLLFGDGWASHGSFAFLRMQQGKAALLHLMIPLTAAYGLLWGREPTRRHFALLAAGQIGCVGFSANGIWIGPAVAGLAVLSAVPVGGGTQGLRTIKTLAVGALASFLPLAWALGVRAETIRAFAEAPNPLASLQFSPAHFMSEGLSTVAGTGPQAMATALALIVALPLAPTAAYRRFLAVNVLGFTALLWNPALADAIGRFVTGPDTYYRVFWVLPVPLIMAAILCGAIPILQRRGSLTLGRGGLALAATCAIAVIVTQGDVTLAANRNFRIGLPDIKVHPDELRIPLALTQASGPEDFVLADTLSSRWLPLLNHSPHPLVIREMLLDVLHDALGRGELTRRVQLTRMVGGEILLPRGGELLAAAIDEYPLQAVAISGRALEWNALTRVLETSALTLVVDEDDYEVWARPDSPNPGQRSRTDEP